MLSGIGHPHRADAQVLRLGIRVSPRTVGKVLPQNLSAHPTTEWTLQQIREALLGDHRYRFVIHDWDYISSKSMCFTIIGAGREIQAICAMQSSLN
jgi:hypothetical protein